MTSSPSPITLVINDRQVPRTQIKLLTLAARGRATMPVEVRLTSEMGLPEGGHWKVQEEVSARLAAKIAILKGIGVSGIVIYLDGNAMLTGDLAELASAAEQHRFLAGTGGDLRSLRLFVVNCNIPLPAPLEKTLGDLLKGTYDAAAEYSALPVAPLPASWELIPRKGMSSKVIDLWALGQRPWYSPFAAAGQQWSDLLLEAVTAGIISPAEMRVDMDQGLLRYSALYQAEHGIVDPHRLPTGLLDLDREHRPPESRVTAQQREMLCKHRFAIPTRPGHPAPPRSLRDYVAYPWRVCKRAAGLLLGTSNFSARERKQLRKQWKQVVRKTRIFQQMFSVVHRQLSRGWRLVKRVRADGVKATGASVLSSVWYKARKRYYRLEGMFFRGLRSVRSHFGAPRTKLNDLLDTERNLGRTVE
jgi:hypothetical protein